MNWSYSTIVNTATDVYTELLKLITNYGLLKIKFMTLTGWVDHVSLSTCLLYLIFNKCMYTFNTQYKIVNLITKKNSSIFILHNVV